MPAVAAFAAAALIVALTAGFGLGLWLLLSRTLGLTTFGAVWLVLVQVHGTVQLFGFAAMFLMGVGLHVLPRFRGAPRPHRAFTVVAAGGTLGATFLRAVAQPLAELPGRDALLAVSGVLLVLGTGAFAVGALRALRGGTNAHRPDELVMAAGVIAAPLAALLVAFELPLRDAPLVVEQIADDRATWAMLLGCLATAIFGVWARLAPGFVASPAAPPRRLLAGAAVWLLGVAGMVAGVPIAAVALLAGLATVTWALGVFGPTIARQPLPDHARLTRLAIRSAFAWGLVGAGLLVAYDLRPTPPGYLEVSAARHAFALGSVTLMIFGVAARAIPAFTDRRLWSLRLQLATIWIANAGVTLRVVPQALDLGGGATAVVALSGVLSYVALAAFAVNIARTLGSRRVPAPASSGPVPIAVRFRRPD